MQINQAANYLKATLNNKVNNIINAKLKVALNKRNNQK